MAEITLPRFDENYEESSIIFWHKQEGDQVEKGDVLVEVQTEKAVSEIEAETDGILEKIVVKRGDVAKVGDVLGVIGAGGAASTREGQATKSETEQAGQQATKQSFVRVAPRLRKLAKELNVNLNEVTGTGRGGNITEDDIRNHADGGSSGEALTGIRKTIADKMKLSLQNSAQLTESAYADVTELAKYRESYDVKLSWNSWIVSALIKALQEHPYMNGLFEDDVWQEGDEVHLGIATDTEQGLLVPVIKNAGNLSVKAIDEKIRELAQAAQDRTLEQSSLSGSTFTITNLGGFGIHFFTPIINPPEVAILGVGKVDAYAAFENGEVKEKQRIPLSLTFDHQVIDGAPAARFMQTLIGYLEQPEKIE